MYTYNLYLFLLTLKLKYQTSNNNLTVIDEFIYHYTGAFYKLYNNPELMRDNTFIDSFLNNFIDKSIYESCVIDVKNKLSQLETSVKNKQNLIDDIKDQLANDTFNTKKEKRAKFKLINKLSCLESTINNDVCFGSKALLRQITKTHNNINNINCFTPNNAKLLKEKQQLLSKYKQQFTKNRKIGIYLVGRACENGNRKVDFDFYNNNIVFKPNKNNKITLTINPKNKQKKTLLRLQELINLKQIPITVRIDRDYIYISYDEEKLNGYAFDDIHCKKEQAKVISKEGKKQIYINFRKELDEKKLKDKLSKRYLSVDLNPHNIGLSIIDKLNDDGEFKIIHTELINLENLSKKLRRSSVDGKQLKQNNKRKHEIRETWKHIFELAKHYKVGYFVMEDLKFKEKGVNNKGKSFNRKVKNIWHRELTVNLINKYCNENGIIKIEVNPCFSSFIGNMMYDCYDSVAASLEIGRRGIIKYKKGSSLYPLITRINQEKLNYLLGENVVIDGITWIKLYDALSLLRYRNLSRDRLTDKKLYSVKSRVLIYQ